MSPPAYRLRAYEEELPAIAAFLDAAGWVRSSEDWRLWWDTDVPSADDFSEAGARLYNHLPGTDVLGVKSLLAEALAAARVRAEQAGRGEAYDFSPRTYLLPHDFDRLQRAAARMPGATWIRKPKALSRGRGVEVLASAADAGSDPENLVQEYVARPHLIDGHKYSLRFYAVVTSLAPLVAFLFHDGFAKLASRPFSLSGDDKLDRFRHLTNPDVLKDDPTVETSSKNLTHANYRARLRREGHDDARLFSRIRGIVQKTLVAARDAMLRAGEGLSQAHRFELFGFDLMVDERLEPVLIECNICPSLAIAAEGDTQAVRDERDVKHRVSRDLMALIGAAPELAPWPDWPVTDAEFAESVKAQTARAGGFERIFPGPGTAALLGDFEAPAPRDLALAAALGLLPPLLPQDARGAALGEGTVVASGLTGSIANLNADDARLWREAIGDTQTVATQIVAMQTIGSAQCERLATWLFERLLGVAELPSAPPPPRSWNRQRSYQLGGYRFALRISGAEAEALLEDSLAPLRSGAPGQAPRAWDVVRHLDGFAIHDPRGARRWRGEWSELSSALFALLRGEAALFNGELGWIDAALIKKGDTSALVVLPPGGARGLINALALRGLTLVSHPTHLRIEEALIASSSPSAPGLTPRHLVRIALLADVARSSMQLERFEACALLLSSAPEELRANPACASKLVEWLARVDATELVAANGDEAAAALFPL